MFKNFKQAREIVRQQEQREEQEKMERNMAKISPNLKDNFNELVKLSELKHSRFRIQGEVKQFVISCKPDYLPIFLWFAFIIAGLAGNIAEMDKSLMLVLTLIYFAFMLLYFKLAPTTWDITVNNYQKQITLKCNNPIGRFLHREVVIDFRDVKKLTGKSVSSKMKDGLNRWFIKVMLHYNDKKTGIIYLANGPLTTIDHEAFINNFINIIQPKEE